MARWRDTKKSKEKTLNKKENESTSSVYGVCTSPLHRIKGFITDMFMIMMPIMYISTYIIMDGKDAFQSSETARWLTMGLYGLITISFWVLKGQTPGFKAYDIKLISDDTQEKPTLTIAIFRYIMFIISAISVIGILTAFFRKDKKTLQDIITKTSVIRINQ